MTAAPQGSPTGRAHAAPVHLVVVGDVLLDRDIDGPSDRLAPDVPVPVVRDPQERHRPGGAGLAAWLACRSGVHVTLIAPLADDAAGRRLLDLLDRVGVTVRPIPAGGATGEKIRVSARGLPLVRVDRGGDATAPRLPDTSDAADAPEAPLAAVETADAVLVADYGRGTTAAAQVRAALTRAVAAGVPVVWDPHPRGGKPVPGARLVTPNRSEAQRWSRVDAGTGSTGGEVGWAHLAADELRTTWAAANVSITMGARGAVLVGGDGTPLVVPAEPIGHVADPCGAGDRFASSATCALARGALPSEAVVEAVADATAFVAAGGAAACTLPDGPADHRRTVAGSADTGAADTESVVDLIRRAQADGATVVATGGCFDLLHAGHVQLLAAARRLGDLLVVCLNSDDSVARLKGPPRPLNTAGDRAAVLRALASVDAVVVFDEDTPERLLERLRPDLWVKGADYAVADLPEAPLLASWGGHAMVLPYLAGRSTTNILEEAHRDR